MKIYHYCLFFCLFSICTMVVSDALIFERNTVSRYSENNDIIFDKAVDSAVDRLRLYTERDSEEVRDSAVEAFFDSLYASLGIADNPASREKLSLYVPVIAISAGDGFYVYYEDNIRTSEGVLQTVRRCTEKQVFSYYENTAREGKCATDFVYRFLGEDSCFLCDTEGICGEKGRVFRTGPKDEAEGSNKILWDTATGGRNYDCLLTDRELFEEKRRDISSNRLEEALTYYCNRHNRIAQENGVSYGFSIPSWNGELFLKAIDGIAFIAFFQGYPIYGGNGVFNCFTVSNARVVSAEGN